MASLLSSPSSQLHSQKVMAAEIMMSNFIAHHNLSFLTADYLSQLLKSMFPDSAIASDFACKRTKTKSIICDALDPYHKEVVISNLLKMPFSLLCDESNDRGASVKLLTILVRSYESERGCIATRHLDTIGITDLTATGIFTAIQNVIKKYSLEISKFSCFLYQTRAMS